jgi:hypothetical protein
VLAAAKLCIVETIFATLLDTTILLHLQPFKRFARCATERHRWDATCRGRTPAHSTAITAAHNPHERHSLSVCSTSKHTMTTCICTFCRTCRRVLRHTAGAPAHVSVWPVCACSLLVAAAALVGWQEHVSCSHSLDRRTRGACDQQLASPTRRRTMVAERNWQATASARGFVCQMTVFGIRRAGLIHSCCTCQDVHNWVFACC